MAALRVAAAGDDHEMIKCIIKNCEFDPADIMEVAQQQDAVALLEVTLSTDTLLSIVFLKQCADR